ncbi:hypothetical protein SCP_0704640 [Sparassis crispa]|uniref:Uncharacterized protein n=1 Tax=Sparassis crispa TaxID=139825 RepID=A0A401GSU0_9APHY|nr:hypothetical protein SCP_0704640 [Sparassis crispa]GBE85277.1 hypothetical protein SCP_0704640 [Sparassis crispa]
MVFASYCFLFIVTVLICPPVCLTPSYQWWYSGEAMSSYEMNEERGTEEKLVTVVKLYLSNWR